MKKVLITGSNGLLGQSMVRFFLQHYEVISASIEKYCFVPDFPAEHYFQLDLTQKGETKSFIKHIKPDVLINTAAFTDVDNSETERDQCWNINARAVEYIVDTCNTTGTIMVQISSDYIFNGSNPPYTEKNVPNPIGFYGKSKFASEKVVQDSQNDYLIARTQILYGTGNNIRFNFVTWLLNELKNNRKVKIVNDQIGNPTYAVDLSEAIYRLLEKEEYGIFHIAGSESLSRYDFALKIARVFDLNKDLITEISTDELKQEAPRPEDSTFVLDKLFNRINWLPSGVEQGLEKLKSIL